MIGDALDRARARGASAEDRRGFVVLEASAGTGKTTVLVDRVLSYVESGERRLHEIAVVTFTELAAAELKVRLRARLDERLAGPLEAAVARRLREALVDLESAAVGTIHSFAAELLRQRPAESGVDPGFTVADELGERLLFTEAWEEFLRAVDPAGEPGLEAAADLGLVTEPALRSAAWAIYRAVRGGQDFAPPPAPPRVVEEVQRIVAALEAAVPQARAGAPLAKDIAAALPELRALAALPERDLARQWLRHPPKMRRGLGQASERDAKRLWAEAVAWRDELTGALAQERLLRLAAWLQPLAARYRRLAAERGRVDFDELIEAALRLVREQQSARRDFRARYPVVMVDEFQDTDGAQTKLLLWLGGVLEDESQHDSEDEADESGPRGFFVVGDPKQSIYRFRGADVENYRRVRESPDARLLRLTQTFRPVPELVGWINQVMGRVMEEGPMADADAIEYSPLEVDPASRLEAAPRGVVYLRLEPPERNNAQACRVREAEAVVRWARWLVEGGDGATQATIRGADGAPRPPRYGDIALLLPAFTALQIYEDALTAAGVPYRIEMGRHFYRRDEIHALVQILRLFADPGDSVATVAVLRGPGFGCSDQALAAYGMLEPAPRFDLRSFASPERLRSSPRPDLAAEVAAGLERLRDLRRETLALPLPEILAAIVERLGLDTYFALQAHGEQHVGNLRKAVELARRMEGQGADSLPRLVHALTDLYDLEIPEADAFVHEGPGDALRILTIHAAKGLEFPVVVLGDYAGKPGASPERLRALGGELRLGSGSDGLSTAGYGAVAEADEQREEHERKRQLYVAVTRARDLLVLPYLEPAPTRVRQVKAGALARHLFDPKVGHALPASLGALRAEVLEMDAATLPARSSAAVPRLDPEAVAALEPDAGGAQHRLSLLAQSRARFGGAGRLIRPSSTETSADVDPPTAAFRQGKARALALGDLAHVLVAERLGRPAPAAYLETRPADLRAAAEVLAATFLASPLAARARRAGPSLRVEEPLCLDGANGLLDGRLDLAFLEDSVWIVVDLKSDRVEAGEVEARSARYRPQAALYATALERVTGRPVAEVHLYFLAPGVDHLLAGGGWSSDCERAAMALTR